MAPTGGSSGGLGITLTVLAALTYAACIMATEKVSQNADPIAIGVIQLGVMGVLSLLIALPTGTFALPTSFAQWRLLLILVLLCSCFGFAFQPMGQKYLPAEAAAIITVMNPLTASVLGIMVAGEAVSAPKLAGYALIIAALVIYNVDFGRRKAPR
jgi:drug/metabolite transporter (DMT)-like permease